MSVCPACHAENPDRARYCLECGAPVQTAGQPEREVRKTVTVLFADIVGSTDIGERLDPELVRSMLARYFSAMRDVIERHGGTVEKFIGDAIMAVFGVPTVHEDDALRAVRAAVGMRDALESLNRDAGERLRVRTGIATGEVVAGTVGGSAMVTGDVVNVAARLEQAAGPDEVLLGEATVALVRDAVDVEAIGPLAVKGRTARVGPSRLVRLRSASEGRVRRLDAPMVGREQETAALRQSFDRAATARSAQLFTVFGAAGAGKSRLIREFSASLAELATVVHGRCLPYGEGITYWPVVAMVQQVAGIEEGDPAAVARGKLERILSAAPEGTTITGRIAEVAGLEPGGAPLEEYFWAVRRFLELAAEARPLVAIIDDLHWAEPTLLDLVEHIADLARDAPILLLGSARPDLIETRPTWGGGRMNATAVLLEPLSEDASSRLIDQLLPGGLSDALRSRIAGAAEGNPLFAEELVAMLVDDGKIVRRDDGIWALTTDLDSTPIPPTISALLAARLDQLERGEREAAERGAVVGRVFDQAALRHMTPEPLRDALVGHLTSLLRKDLVRTEPRQAGGDTAYRFRHILIRDAAYESIPKAERADLHERFADWLETTAGDRLVEVEEIVGYHLAQAVAYRREVGALDRTVELGSRAARHLSAAGLRAADRGDARAAVALLERATGMLGPQDPTRTALLVELGTALDITGDLAAARRLFDEVVDATVSTPDAPTRHHAIVQRRVIEHPLSQSGADPIPDAEAALRAFEASGDDLGMARAFALLSRAHWEAGRGAEADQAASASLRHAERSGRQSQIADSFNELSAILSTGPAPFEEGIRRCEELLAAHPGERMAETWIHHTLAHLHARRGNIERGRELATRVRSVLLENGQVQSHALMAELVADVELMAGNPAAAIEALRDAVAVTASVREPDAMLSAFLARAAWHGGDNKLARSAAEQGLTGGGWIRPFAELSLGRVLAAEGQLDAALATAQRSVEFFARTDFLTFHAWALEALADVQIAAGLGNDAATSLEHAIELHDQKGNIAAADRARAALEGLREPFPPSTALHSQG